MEIRDGNGGDVEWADRLAPELASFGLPAWRDTEVFVEQCRSGIRRALENGDPRDRVRVAVEDGEPCGLSHLVLRPDASTGRDAVHVDDVVVEPGLQGRGIGWGVVCRRRTVGPRAGRRGAGAGRVPGQCAGSQTV